jgi:arylsulfatase
MMKRLKEMGIAENTLVVFMADNGPMTHNGPVGMVEVLYRGGKGDYTEGGIRVAAMASWPGMIEPGQTVGDIIHITDLFTTFARIGGATEHIPTDRIIDGVDQTALFLNGDSHSRRDYVHVYTGNVYAATVKGRFKRHWVGELPGLSGANFFDLYNDPREVQGMMLPMFPTKGMFSTMKARHELWMEKYPNAKEAEGLPFTGLANARPETIKASQPRFTKDQVPFDVEAVMKRSSKYQEFEANWSN